MEPDATNTQLVEWTPEASAHDSVPNDLRLLADQQRFLSKQVASTRDTVGQVYTALEMMVGVLSEALTRWRQTPSMDPAVAEDITRVLTEVKSLRTFVEQKPDPPALNLRELTVPLTAAFERLDRRTAEHIEKTVNDRMQGLYEALRDEFEQQNTQRDRFMRREVDRLLFIALGVAGLLTGGGLWLLLKP